MKEQSGHLSRQKNFILLLLILVIPTCGLAQVFPYAFGAKSWGIANATVASSDAISAFNNVASLGGTSEAILFSSYHSHYGFEGLSTLGFGGLIPLSADLGTAFSVQRFGDKFYNETAVGLGAGHRIGRVSLGLKINYLQNAVNAPSLIFSRKALVLEFGGIVKVNSEFSLGAHVFNMTQSSFSGGYGSRVPTVLRAGFHYMPLETVSLSAEFNKNTDLPASLRAGLEYRVWKSLYLRTGIGTRPVTNHFGVGIKGGKFYFDYAFNTHQQLGIAHHFSLGYRLGKMKTADVNER